MKYKIIYLKNQIEFPLQSDFCKMIDSLFTKTNNRPLIILSLTDQQNISRQHTITWPISVNISPAWLYLSVHTRTSATVHPLSSFSSLCLCGSPQWLFPAPPPDNKSKVKISPRLNSLPHLELKFHFFTINKL